MAETSSNWFTKAFLEKILKTYKNGEDVAVEDFQVGGGFDQHFASDLFKCQIKFSSASGSETLNVIVKSQPVDDELKKHIVSDGPFFQNEIKMYHEVLPAMHSLFEKHGMQVEFEPELIYASEDPFPIVILKDLSPQGFYALKEPFDDFEDTKLVFQRLAQFHAASYFLIENDGFDFSSFNYSFFQNEKSANLFMKDTFEAFIEVVATWDDFKQYLPNLEHVKDNICSIGLESSKVNKPGQGYNVLNHADFHNRNVLVKMNETNRIEKLLFIDFQISLYCSPAFDLSMSSCFAKHYDDGGCRLDEVVKFYHEEFVKTLKTFDFHKPIPSLEDLNDEIVRHGQLKMLFDIAFLAFALDNWDNFKFEEMIGDGSENSRNYKKSHFEKPVFKKYVQKKLKSWVQMGWL